MSEKYEIKTTCSTCNETGIAPGGEMTDEAACPDCNQTGYEFQAKIDDLRDDINDIKGKLEDIWEKLNE